MTNCPKCNSTNFVIYDQVLYPENKVVGRVLECYDCRDAEIKRTIEECSGSKLRTRYAKTKLRTDWYGTVTVKDIIDE
jgi:transcriptional regulator NrdR family protein